MAEWRRVARRWSAPSIYLAEADFVPMYEGAPTIREVAANLRARGFECVTGLFVPCTAIDTYRFDGTNLKYTDFLFARIDPMPPCTAEVCRFS